MSARLLVVEDNPQNMKLAVAILEGEGYTVIPAPDAEEALAAIALESPDAILLDIALPGMDGLTLAKILKNDAKTAHVPLVALTALAMKGDRERALAAGFDEYLTKPIDRPLLLHTIERMLDPGAR